MFQSNSSKKKSDPVEFSLLMQDLISHVETKGSGNFFIVTDDNASCRFAVSNGVITHCAFKRHKGLDALEVMLTSGIKGVGRFASSLSPLKRSIEAVDHDLVLKRLNIKKPDKSVAEAPKSIEVDTSISEPPPIEAPVAKPRRMYRGQPIDD